MLFAPAPDAVALGDIFRPEKRQAGQTQVNPAEIATAGQAEAPVNGVALTTDLGKNGVGPEAVPGRRRELQVGRETFKSRSTTTGKGARLASLAPSSTRGYYVRLDHQTEPRIAMSMGPVGFEPTTYGL